MTDASGESPAGTAPLVLIVADDKDFGEATSRFCELQGFRVANAEDAPDAMQKALLLHPKVIVLDLMLPTMPGWELAKSLRADARTAHIPILAISRLGREAERKARAAGA